MSGRAWFWGIVLGFVTWAIILVLFIWLTPAHASDPASPCQTLRYRGRVVNVTLFGQELALDGNEAYKALRSGHPYKARQYLRAIHGAYPEFGIRSDGLIHRTYLCGVVG